MNLIIDGNYILNRNVFSLTKEKLLYGYLHESLTKSLDAYCKWYPFKNIYFVSDSRTNWRKKVYPEYKGNRKKSDEIDWEFVFTTYNEFKENLPNRVKLLEVDNVEGDDWFYYLTEFHNKKGESTLIVSNDGDLKQLLNTGKEFINVMVNENHRHNNIYLPIGYSTWMSEHKSNLPVPGLFDDTISEDLSMLKFIDTLIDTRTIKEVDPSEVIFERIVSGDKGDNIITVWGKEDVNGNLRGLGAKSAEKIYGKYIEYFGIPKFDQECFDRISDIIIEFKKLNHDEFDKINKNIIFNNRLVNLSKIPKQIIQSIKDKHDEFIN